MKLVVGRRVTSRLPTVFPLGKTGGLIEAPRNRARGCGRLGFRWVKPAASLKQD